MTKRWAGAVVAMALALSACGTNPGDRVESGAAIGGGAGLVIGAAFGGIGVIPAGLVGAAIGAGTGAITNPRQIDLGKPVWR